MTLCSYTNVCTGVCNVMKSLKIKSVRCTLIIIKPPSNYYFLIKRTF